MGLLLPVKFLWFPVKSEEENRQMPESTKQHKLGTTSEASPGSKAAIPRFSVLPSHLEGLFTHRCCRPTPAFLIQQFWVGPKYSPV